MLIGGELIEAEGAELVVIDPATGEERAVLPDATAAQVDAAVVSARGALGGEWAELSAAERGRILYRIAERLEEEGDYISALESSDNGRPRRETAAQAVIVAKWFRYYAGMADKIEGTTIPVEGPYLNFTERVPVGVCAAITPWNHPMLIATKKIAPALACGNTMIVKPSELAPLSLLEFARMTTECGLPPGVLNIVSGGPETGRALVEHPDVDRVDLTGSTATGVRIAETAAKTLKRVGLELGGKAANLVFADTDLDRTADGVVFSGFIAQGQSCVSGARVLVEASIADEFIDAMKTRIESIRLGSPQDLRTQMGPVITPASVERIAAFVEGSREQGAEVLCGGRQPKGMESPLRPDAYYEPTLIRTDDPNIDVAQKEIFGPVVTVIPFGTESEAVEIANSTPFGLGAGVWTADALRAHRVADALRAGITWINDYHRIDPASPWGGFKLSGYGRENGYFAVEEYTEAKSVWVPRAERPMDWYDDDAFGARLN
jgi:acyl-CoA reductase-like NAD-dependent aldehyde dehydrogenase